METFYPSHRNVHAAIYGSIATGLALPESDIDIVITGVNSFGNKDTHK
jgi:predicted nucleotidyltransferase